MSDPGRKTVLIVDDHPVLRRGLTSLVDSEPDLAVCGEADCCRTALAHVRKYKPSLVTADLSLKGSDGLDLFKAMKTRFPEIPVLVLSMHDEKIYAERTLRAGARGYVTKQQLDETVLVAIRRLLDGGSYMSERVQGRLAARYIGGNSSESDSPVDALSNRELQVFRLIGQGTSTSQIAQFLHLSRKTIESHREHIKHKLCIESAPELACRATQWVETGRTE